MDQNYFRWFETEDEYFPYAQYPLQGRWMIYGQGLPDDVLEKVYHRNGEALFARFRAAQQSAASGIVGGSADGMHPGQIALDNFAGHQRQVR